MAIKNIIFVDTVMNISAKFQLYPPHGFWVDDFWIFFLKFSILVANQNNSEVWTKIICLLEDYSMNISIKLLSKYMQWESNKFSLFPLKVNGNFKLP